MKSRQVLIIFLVVFLLTILAIQSFRSSGPVEVGKAAPQFTLKDMAGREVSLDDYRGELVILDFWATWCQPCRISMPILENIQKEYSGSLSILAVNWLEPKGVVREFILEQNLDATVLLDEDGSVGRRYGVGGIPFHVLVDRNGIVRHIAEGVESPKVWRDEIRKLL